MPRNDISEKGMPADGIAKPRLTREQIAQRAALELPDGAYVNLGWGIPNLIAGHLPKGITVYFHSENGILGMGPRAKPGEEDFDQVDAMKVPVTLIPGASFFHQADAHLMTRGGHLDVAVLGGFQVSEKGDLANWRIPGAKGPGGIGGCQDIDRLHGAHHQGRRAENREVVYLSADLSGMCRHHRHRSRGHRR